MRVDLDRLEALRPQLEAQGVDLANLPEPGTPEWTALVGRLNLASPVLAQELSGAQYDPNELADSELVKRQSARAEGRGVLGASLGKFFMTKTANGDPVPNTNLVRNLIFGTVLGALAWVYFFVPNGGSAQRTQTEEAQALETQVTPNPSGETGSLSTPQGTQNSSVPGPDTQTLGTQPAGDFQTLGPTGADTSLTVTSEPQETVISTPPVTPEPLPTSEPLVVTAPAPTGSPLVPGAVSVSAPAPNLAATQDAQDAQAVPRTLTGTDNPAAPTPRALVSTASAGSQTAGLISSRSADAQGAAGGQAGQGGQGAPALASQSAAPRYALASARETQGGQAQPETAQGAQAALGASLISSRREPSTAQANPSEARSAQLGLLGMQAATAPAASSTTAPEPARAVQDDRPSAAPSGTQDAVQASTPTPVQAQGAGTPPPAPFPYSIGRPVKVKLVMGVAAVGREGSAELPVYAEGDGGHIWRGRAQPTGQGRVALTFDAVLIGNQAVALVADAYGLDGQIGVPARARLVTPNVAATLLGGLATGAKQFAEAMLNQRSVQVSVGGTEVVSNTARPNFWVTALGAAVGGFSVPSAAGGMVQVQELAPGTELQVVVRAVGEAR